MIEKLTHEQFGELFKKLPEPLQDALYAQETGENIESICERNKIPEMFDFVNNGVGDVYLGVLSPDKFFADLKKELKGKTGIKQIILEIDNFLFYPYKNSLAKIYQLDAPQPKTAPAPTTNAEPNAQAPTPTV